ncbi:MAG TPA: hypothetical protein VFK80_04380 [Limnochordia bacterium]|nr:hypothetical protein [Limnochordia bacterium]
MSSRAAVSIPGELIAGGAVRSSAKLLYGALQLAPDFRHPTGRTTYSELSEMVRLDDQTVRRGLHELAAAGWIDLDQEHRRAAVRYTLRNPIAERAAALAAAARRRVEKAPFRGEALMREYLTLIIDSDQFEDDASPGFLVNPQSGEGLQLDRTTRLGKWRSSSTVRSTMALRDYSPATRQLGSVPVTTSRSESAWNEAYDW